MKRLITVILILALLLPAASWAEYQSKLGITIAEFIDAFTSADNPLMIDFNENMRVKKWPSPSEEPTYAYLNPCRSGLLLMVRSADPDFYKNMDAGIDQIIVRTTIKAQLTDMIGIADRCLQIFGDSVTVAFSRDGKYYCFTVRADGDAK